MSINQFIFYRSSDNWYIRLVDFRNGTVWDENVGVLSSLTSWNNSVIRLNFSTVIGGHPVIFPSELMAGTYDVLFYNSANPLVSDSIEIGKRVTYNGVGLSELPQDL